MNLQRVSTGLSAEQEHPNFYAHALAKGLDRFIRRAGGLDHRSFEKTLVNLAARESEQWSIYHL